MTAPRSRRDRLAGFVGAALIVGGGAASIGFMLRAAHPPPILLALFLGWVLSPFVAVGFMLAGRAGFQNVPIGRRYACVAGAVAGSLVIYARVIPMPPGTRPAFPYLMVPLAAWALIVITRWWPRRPRP